jgi:hypothetical protein
VVEMIADHNAQRDRASELADLLLQARQLPP